ncbi:MAG: hypothetical protein JKP98_14430 [Rhodobacteraceae bacterium]|nr:hypothetical protein [Paracoccaceae bacterium]
MRDGAVIMAHERNVGPDGGVCHMLAHGLAVGAGAFEQFVHQAAAFRLVDLHVADHVPEPLVDVRALPVSRGVIHDRDELRLGQIHAGIHQARRRRVGDLAAQVQEVLRAEQVLRDRLTQRCHKRFEQIAALLLLHRGADRKTVEDRGRPAGDDHGVMGQERGQRGPEDPNARMGVTLDMVGVQIDDAGDQVGPVQIAPVPRQGQASDPVAVQGDPALDDTVRCDEPGIAQDLRSLRAVIEHGSAFNEPSPRLRVICDARVTVA